MSKRASIKQSTDEPAVAEMNGQSHTFLARGWIYEWK